MKTPPEPTLSERIAEAEAKGDFGTAHTLKTEMLTAKRAELKAHNTPDMARVEQLRVDSDAAMARGDFSTAARLKAEWLTALGL